MSSSSCVQCKHPRDVGTRCFRHYVYVLAFERGLLKHRWFKLHFDEVVAGLRGRWLLIQSGETPSTAHELAVLLWKRHRGTHHGEHRDTAPSWIIRDAHRAVKPGSSRDNFYKLVAALDQRARKDGPAVDSADAAQEEAGGSGSEA